MRNCRNCIFVMNYTELKKIAPIYIKEQGIKRGNLVCIRRNYELIKNTKKECEFHVFKQGKGLNGNY